MELSKVYAEQKEHMEKSITSLKRDFSTIRSGKVTITVLDNIHVDYYGTPTALTQVATVLATDATTITITPWEKKLIKEIEKAIMHANIGVNPNNDGESIKLFFPAMTSEQRKESAKQAKVMGDKAKIAIRNVRKDSNDKVKKLEKDKLITEDQSKKGQDEVQKITDETVKKVDDLVNAKEAELLKI